MFWNHIRLTGVSNYQVSDQVESSASISKYNVHVVLYQKHNFKYFSSKYKQKLISYSESFPSLNIASLDDIFLILLYIHKTLFMQDVR